MKKFWNVLKLVGILICFVLLLAFLFFDIIDWIIPGSFPNWVYVADLAVSVVIAVLALVMFIGKCCNQHKAKKTGDRNEL